MYLEFSASLTDYPAHGAQVQAWKKGIHLARKLAVEVGMGVENNMVANRENDVAEVVYLVLMAMIALLGFINHSSMPELDAQCRRRRSEK